MALPLATWESVWSKESKRQLLTARFPFLVGGDTRTTLSRLGSVTVSEEKSGGIHWKNIPQVMGKLS